MESYRDEIIYRDIMTHIHFVIWLNLKGCQTPKRFGAFEETLVAGALEAAPLMTLFLSVLYFCPLQTSSISVTQSDPETVQIKSSSCSLVIPPILAF